MSWGLGEWGLDVWGASATLEMEAAVAATTHSVVVTLTRAPRAYSPISPGDALNPASWEVFRTDTTKTFTPIGVLQLTNRRFQIFLRQALSSRNYSHTVRSNVLRSAATGVLISSPRSATFPGVLATTAVNEPRGAWDFESANVLSGTLQTTAAGTYQRIFTEDVLRKLIFRRLTTLPGSYYHLAQDEFGQGLKVKERMRASSLPALKVNIEQEIKKEPNVLGATATLSLDSSGLSIHVLVKTPAGDVETTVVAS